MSRPLKIIAGVSNSSAAVALVHARGPVESVLLIRRANNPRDPWSGHWAFPGGRRDPTDADLLATALRELYEECAILLPREAVTQALPPSFAGRRVGKYVSVAPFVFHVENQLETRLNAPEAVGALWIPVELLHDPSRHRWQPVPWLPPEETTPAIELDGTPLWGFTYRVLCDWLGVRSPPPDNINR